MRSLVKTLIVSCALLLSACTTVTPAYKDIGVRNGPCVNGGPDSVAQQFYDYRLAHTGQDTAGLRPYLSDALWQQLEQSKRNSTAQQLIPFDSHSSGFDSASVNSASTIPNTDARNIPLRVTLKKGDRQWRDEVLMIREGTCWAVDDIRHLDADGQTPSATLRESLAATR